MFLSCVLLNSSLFFLIICPFTLSVFAELHTISRLMQTTTSSKNYKHTQTNASKGIDMASAVDVQTSKNLKTNKRKAESLTQQVNEKLWGFKMGSGSKAQPDKKERTFVGSCLLGVVQVC